MDGSSPVHFLCNTTPLSLLGSAEAQGDVFTRVAEGIHQVRRRADPGDSAKDNDVRSGRLDSEKMDFMTKICSCMNNSYLKHHSMLEFCHFMCPLGIASIYSYIFFVGDPGHILCRCQLSHLCGCPRMSSISKCLPTEPLVSHCLLPYTSPARKDDLSI